MPKSITIRGRVSGNGKLSIFNKENLTKWLHDAKEKDVQIEFEVRKSKRSNPQNSYMWGVVIPAIQRGLNEYGNEFTKQETHEFLKAKFNYKEVEINDGHYIDVPQSTTKLDTIGFEEYLEKIKQFGSEMLNIYIPDPHEDAVF